MKRLLRLSAVATLAAATGVGIAATPADAASTIVVGPGQSIQAAVDRAHSGDTILLKPGHYRQSILVKKDHLRIRGSGSGMAGTVIEPAATPQGLCARNDSGICVVDPKGGHTVSGVSIDNILVRNFKASGVFALRTSGSYLSNVVARDNGEYGIARFGSSGGGLVNNVTTGSGEAGLYIGDSPHANAFVAGNDVSGNSLGIFYRHSQHAVIQFNTVHDNCIGIFAVSAPAPVGSGQIRYNTVRNNNKLCKGNPEEIPFDYSGGGIVLVGTTGELVGDNAVLNNRGTSAFSGGIVLVSGAPFGGPASSGNTIQRNTAYRNAPADIVDHSGGSNIFRHNFCSSSLPGGHCQH